MRERLIESIDWPQDGETVRLRAHRSQIGTATEYLNRFYEVGLSSAKLEFEPRQGDAPEIPFIVINRNEFISVLTAEDNNPLATLVSNVISQSDINLMRTNMDLYMRGREIFKRIDGGEVTVGDKMHNMLVGIFDKMGGACISPERAIGGMVGAIGSGLLTNINPYAIIFGTMMGGAAGDLIKAFREAQDELQRNERGGPER